MRLTRTLPLGEGMIEFVAPLCCSAFRHADFQKADCCVREPDQFVMVP